LTSAPGARSLRNDPSNRFDRLSRRGGLVRVFPHTRRGRWLGLASAVAVAAAGVAGGTVQFGFQGTWTSSDANPTSFTLNGSACTTG
jgi:hypothetical protein